MAEKMKLIVEYDDENNIIVVEQSGFLRSTKWPSIANAVEEVMKRFAEGQPTPVFRRLVHADGTARWEGVFNDGIHVTNSCERIVARLSAAVTPLGVDVETNVPKAKKKRAKRPGPKPTTKQMLKAYEEWVEAAQKLRSFKLMAQAAEEQEAVARKKLHNLQSKLGIQLAGPGIRSPF